MDVRTQYTSALRFLKQGRKKLTLLLCYNTLSDMFKYRVLLNSKYGPF